VSPTGKKTSLCAKIFSFERDARPFERDVSVPEKVTHVPEKGTRVPEKGMRGGWSETNACESKKMRGVRGVFAWLRHGILPVLCAFMKSGFAVLGEFGNGDLTRLKSTQTDSNRFN
jgi:hypothetical protein